MGARLLALVGALLLLGALAGPARAVPRFSITAGSPCTTCHVNPTGAGLRNAIGFESMDDVGLVEYGVTPHNALFDDLLTLGADVRIQAVRLGAPEIPPGETEIVEPELSVIPMQVQPYIGLNPHESLWIYASWTAGPNTFGEGKLCDTVYAGQSCFDAAIQWQPDPSVPMLRAGMIQPSIGIRRDDHTLYIRGDAADRRAPLVPPNYADWGAEFSYQPVSWFRGEVGAVLAQNLDEALNTGANRAADLWPAAVSTRVMFLPQLVFGGAEPAPASEDEFGDDFGDDFDAAPAPDPFVINTWIGASAQLSDEYRRIDAFAAAGIHQGVELHVEAAYVELGEDYTVFNQLLGASYAPRPWIALAARAEHAATTHEGEESVAWQYVAGLEFFPLPFVEIRPEYRIVKTDAYLFGQPTVQLHLFY
ncbi:MAG: hypothetical protein R3F65_06515 [bacterium]